VIKEVSPSWRLYQQMRRLLIQQLPACPKELFRAPTLHGSHSYQWLGYSWKTGHDADEVKSWICTIMEQRDENTFD
jgi:hypothetical protein